MNGWRSCARGRLGALLSERLAAVGERLFGDADARARARGWTVQARCGGLARRYADTRFDRLASCPACGGSGTENNERCWRCHSTGRIDLSEPSVAEGRRT
jgi:hypothetical protein